MFLRKSLRVSALAVFPACQAHSFASCDYDQKCGVSYATKQLFSNWSNTKNAAPIRLYEPQSSQEVGRVLQLHHAEKKKLRVVGTALSPNGIGMCDNNSNALSLSNIDYVEIDTINQQVTVGAGATVSGVLSELKKKGLTLSNFSSIQAQQIGGWMQVAAHGTGATLSTVDEMIVRMKLAIPAGGLLSLSNTSNKDLFDMAKVGLGCLGVVTELTLKCIPQHNLKEDSVIIDRSSAQEGHIQRLRDNRHVRYMWIPFTSDVVAVRACMTAEPITKTITPTSNGNKYSDATLEMRKLLNEIDSSRLALASTSGLAFSELRDLLLDHGPLNVEHVKQVNKAEASFWRGMVGTRVDDSTNILGFDCGGEQWVFEVCLPMGRLSELPVTGPSKDIEFVKKLLSLTEKAGVAAASPVEQRWTSSSSAYMSPAYHPETHCDYQDVRGTDKAQAAVDDPVFSWVGIIMYMPPHQDDNQRQEIAVAFKKYCELLQPLLDEYNAHPHWAKIELPGNSGTPEYAAKLKAMKARLNQRYDVARFKSYQQAVDPNFVLSNHLTTELFVNK